jgi:hypothetical protein
MIRAGSAGNPSQQPGGSDLQSAQPRDLGALALVVGLFLVLFIVTVMYGAPPR